MLRLAILLLMTTNLLADPLLERDSLDNFQILIREDAIHAKIDEVASAVKADLAEEGVEHVTIVLLMKGGICIGSDFMRALDMSSTLECIRTSSYGQRGMERGQLTITGLDNIAIEEKDILLVDDIFDSGVTLASVAEAMEARNPKSLRSIVLLNKEVDKQVDYTPDYTLFDIPNLFVIGYGMDYKERWRDLKHVYYIQ